MNRNLVAIKILFIALLIFLTRPVAAGTITIAWDSSSSGDVAGYAVYYGYRSGEYPTRIDAGNQLSLEFEAQSGTNYFFVVTAYSLSGIESFPSAEASYLPDLSSPDVVITSPTSSSTFITTNNFVSLAGTASDNAGIAQVTWSNRCSGFTGVAIGATDWIANDISLCIGTNVIVVTARDFEGNIDEELLTVTRIDPCGGSFAAGTFNGLFADVLAPESSGFFTLKKGTSDSFTGTIKMGGWRRGFSGKFTNGIATISIARIDADPLTLQLQAEPCDQERITGTVVDGAQATALLADRVVFNSRTNPASIAGKYTLAIFGTSNAPASPEGIGFATARVLASGVIRVHGVLGDGKNFAQSTYISRSGFWPFYASPYRQKRGSISGWLNFSSQTESDLHGDLTWTKPAMTNDLFYPSGFSNSVAVIGSIYNAPTNSSNRVLNLSDGTVTLTGGELVQGFAKDVILATNRIVPAPPGMDKLRFNINKNIGSFTGTINLPGYPVPVRIRGGLLQKKNAGYGLFSGTNQVGQVLLESAP